MFKRLIFVWVLGWLSAVVFAQDTTPIATLNTQYSAVYEVAYRSDNGQFATLSVDPLSGFTSLQLWDSNTFAPLGTLQQDGQFIQDFAYQPNSTYVITTGIRGEVNQWDSNTLTLVNTVKGHETTAEIAFSPNGETFVTADYSGVIIWAASTFEPLLFLNSGNDFEDALTPLAISADSQYLAWVQMPSTINVVELATGNLVARIMTGYELEPYDLAFTADNHLALAYGTLEIWQMNPAQRQPGLSTTDAVSRVILNADGSQTFVLGVLGGITQWDSVNLQPMRTIRTEGLVLAWSMALNSDETVLAVGLDNGSVEFYALES
jgi:WD40 repeat protein